jgi:hypothetical protein
MGSFTPNNRHFMSAARNRQRCPDPSSLERWYLTAGQHQSRIAIHNHIDGCRHCRYRVLQIETFYRILMQELADGPDPAALDFCKRLAPKTTTYGLLICSPLPDRNDRRGQAYLATLAFSANGNGSTARLAGYQLPPKHIGVMAYTDAANDQQILISRLKGQNLARWQLSIPGIAGPLTLSNAGSARLPLLGIEALHNQLFFFKKSRKHSHPGSPISQIRSSLSL